MSVCRTLVTTALHLGTQPTTIIIDKAQLTLYHLWAISLSSEVRRVNNHHSTKTSWKPVDLSTQLWFFFFSSDLHNDFFTHPSKIANSFHSGFEILFFDFVILTIRVRVYGWKKHLQLSSHTTWLIKCLTFSEAGEKDLPCFPKILSPGGIGKGNLNFPEDRRKVSDLQTTKCWQIAGNRDEWQAMFWMYPLRQTLLSSRTWCKYNHLRSFCSGRETLSRSPKCKSMKKLATSPAFSSYIFYGTVMELFTREPFTFYF